LVSDATTMMPQAQTSLWVNLTASDGIVTFFFGYAPSEFKASLVNTSSEMAVIASYEVRGVG
jgi:hypothetical protein